MPTKTAAPKPASPKARTAKPANSAAKPSAKSPAPPVVASAQNVVSEAAKVALSLRVKDLIDRVTAAGAFKKKDVRDIVEATLIELGRALDEGYSLNLPPFGKMHIRNSRVIDNGNSAMTLKVRRGPSKVVAANVEKEGLAEVSEAV